MLIPCAYWLWLLPESFQSRMQKVRMGMREEEVEAILGPPRGIFYSDGKGVYGGPNQPKGGKPPHDYVWSWGGRPDHDYLGMIYFNADRRVKSCSLYRRPLKHLIEDIRNRLGF